MMMNDRERLLELAEAVIAANIHHGEMVRVNELAEDILYRARCSDEELDGDFDVDLKDYAILQNEHNGE